jgi:hypothetical protein
MADEKFSNDETVNDLNIISDKLGKVVRHKKKEIEDIQGVQKKVDFLTDYWQAQPVPSTPWANTSLVSGATFVHDFRNYVEGFRPEEFIGPVLGSVVASGSSMSSAGMTLFHVAPPPEPARRELEIKFIEINNAPKRKERRKEVRCYLKKVSPHLADAYDAAWENLETNFSDPLRGAAFLMREVVSQVLDLLAPDKLIRVQDGFVVDPTARDGVTRRHKLEYIGNNLAKDATKKKLIEDSSKSFLYTYGALCDAHKRTPLDKSKTESFLFQADDLLILILGAVRLE